MGSLVDKSLLRVNETADDEVRFVMLDTLREFAAEQLHVEPQADQVLQRHAHAFLELAEEAQPHLASAAREPWLRRLEADYENLRNALLWLLEHSDGRRACRLSSALGWFWYFQGRVGEGRHWLERALDSADVGAVSIERARALATLGHLAWLQGDRDAARRWLEEAQSLSLSLGDRYSRAHALIILAFVLDDGNETRRAQVEDESLALSRELGDAWWAALALLGTGIRALGRGDPATARARLEESLRLWEQLGDTWFIAQALNGLADVARSESDDERAGDLYARSLAGLRQHLDYTVGAASVLHNLGYIARHQNDHRRALGLFVEALDIFENQGDHRGIAECLAGIGAAILGLGQPEHAVRLFGASDALLASIGTTPWPSNLTDVRDAHTLARAQLAEHIWIQALAEGGGLSSERAIAYARQLAEEHLAAADLPVAVVPAGLPRGPLTAREREIALLLARGYSNRQLAETLVITEQTAETHVKRILGKLELRSRHQVTEWASRTGLAG
jgi:DNA-binding CsgD family transcriptional regulator/Tfp pilus assembly protein PilF